MLDARLLCELSVLELELPLPPLQLLPLPPEQYKSHCFDRFRKQLPANVLADPSSEYAAAAPPAAAYTPAEVNAYSLMLSG